jgi:alpha-beta hydrolase superfamily lysophospholipase
MSIPNFLLSSTGEGIALRWKAGMAAVIPFLVVVGPMLGLNIAAEEWNQLTGQVSNLIIGIWSLASIVGFLAGWVRRNFNRNAGTGKFSAPINNPLE